MAKNQEVIKDVRAAQFNCGTNQQGVAKLLGVTPRYLSDVINGRQPYSENLRSRIHELCPSQSEPREKNGIPVFDNARFGCSPSGFMGALEKTEVDDYIVVPGLENDGQTFIVRASGDSMINKQNPERSIPSGAYVAVQKSLLSTPQWGETYALSTNDGCIIKRLYPSEREGYVKCVSFNGDEFPTFELHRSEIHDIGIVKAVLSLHIWK